MNLLECGLNGALLRLAELHHLALLAGLFVVEGVPHAAQLKVNI